MKGVVADRDGLIIAEVRRPTPSPDPTGALVVDAVAEVVAALDADPTAPVGVVVPGIVDEMHGKAVYSANLGWSDVPLARMLSERLGRRVGFGHDVRAGALAEARWGAASGASGIIAFVPIGTGIAAAFLIDGRPVVGGGWAGEIGQVRLSTGPHAGARVEEIASATGIARRAGLADARVVAERVASGDPALRIVWDETIEVLADVLAGLTANLAPETIVLGGGVALAGDTLTSPLAAALDARLGPLRRPDLRTAMLGDRAAALGAALIATGSSGSSSSASGPNASDSR
ncbi:ROK family protein [Microbacterium ginsengiterrae]